MKIAVQSAGVTDCIGMEAGYAAIAKAGFTAIDWNGIEHGISGEQIRKLEYKGSVFEKPLDERIFRPELAQEIVDELSELVPFYRYFAALAAMAD